MTTLLLATLLLMRPTAPTPLGRAIEYVESRGNPFAVSPVGARGLWQVMPSVARVPVWLLHVPAVGRAEGRRILARWRVRCKESEWGAATRSGESASHDRATAVDGVSETSRTTKDRGTTPLRSAVKDRLPANDSVLRCALRAYACGTKGLRGACDWYAAAVLREVK